MTPSEFSTATAQALLDGLAGRAWRSADLVTASLARIDALDRRGPTLRAMTHAAAGEARAAAEASDARRARGEPIGPLEGVPVLVKDNIDVAGWPTTAGSRALIGLVAQRDAEIVSRLRAAGAILVGKTAMHELAAGITGASSLTGFARNPHALDRSPGGSSSGAAVAVAAGYAPIAIGSDTAGSVRIPAAFNRLYGLRATRGAVSLRGIVPLSPTQDIPGPLARHPDDLRRTHAVLAGPTDATPPTPPALKIGRLEAWFEYDTVAAAQVATVADRALEHLARAGHDSQPVVLVDLEAEVEAANVIAYEFAEALAADLAQRPDSPVDSLQAVLDRGLEHPHLTAVFQNRVAHSGTDSTAYRTARTAQTALRTRVLACLDEQGLDMLAYPTVRHPATERGGTQSGSNALLAAVTGLPAINLPVGFDIHGAGVGLELLGRPGGEPLLLSAAHAWYELDTPWATPAGLRP